MIDTLNYLLALSALFFGYRIYVSRRKGKTFKEIRTACPFSTVTLEYCPASISSNTVNCTG